MEQTPVPSHADLGHSVAGQWLLQLEKNRRAPVQPAL